MPDHGTSGLSFGDGAYKDYASKGLDSAYMNISKVRRTASGLEKILLKARPEQIRPLFREYTGIELTDDELALLRSSRNYTEADYMKVANSVNMVSSIARIVTSRTHFGFLSGSHTAEDVFLAAYHPEGDLPVGRNTNTEVHAYMADLLGLERPLAELTGELFAPHTEVFRGAKCSISAAEGQMPCLTVRKGRRTLRVPAYGSVAYLDGQAPETALGSGLYRPQRHVLPAARAGRKILTRQTLPAVGAHWDGVRQTLPAAFGTHSGFIRPAPDFGEKSRSGFFSGRRFRISGGFEG